MEKIGVVCRLQVQVANLKQGATGFRYYDPSPLRTVDRLQIDQGGVLGFEGDTPWPDIHHADHPASKFRGHNGLSVNVTGHYAAMRERFGPHLTDGIAGENILIDAAAFPFAGDGAGLLVIRAANGFQTVLGELSVAAPCEPFSRFALDLDVRPPAAMMKDTLQFLDGGRRGFYATLTPQPSDQVPAAIHLGDQVLFVPRA